MMIIEAVLVIIERVLTLGLLLGAPWALARWLLRRARLARERRRGVDPAAGGAAAARRVAANGRRCLRHPRHVAQRRGRRPDRDQPGGLRLDPAPDGAVGLAVQRDRRRHRRQPSPRPYRVQTGGRAAARRIRHLVPTSERVGADQEHQTRRRQVQVLRQLPAMDVCGRRSDVGRRFRSTKRNGSPLVKPVLPQTSVGASRSTRARPRAPNAVRAAALRALGPCAGLLELSWASATRLTPISGCVRAMSTP